MSITDTSEKKWLSPKEAARKTGFSVKTLYTYMSQGKIAYSKMGLGRGARVRIENGDLESFMTENRRKAFTKEV